MPSTVSAAESTTPASCAHFTEAAACAQGERGGGNAGLLVCWCVFAEGLRVLSEAVDLDY